jgi:hypothetical protein
VAFSSKRVLVDFSVLHDDAEILFRIGDQRDISQRVAVNSASEISRTFLKRDMSLPSNRTGVSWIRCWCLEIPAKFVEKGYAVRPGGKGAGGGRTAQSGERTQNGAQSLKTILHKTCIEGIG